METCFSPAPRITLPLSGMPTTANAMAPTVATMVLFGAVMSQVRPFCFCAFRFFIISILKKNLIFFFFFVVVDLFVNFRRLVEIDNR